MQCKWCFSECTKEGRQNNGTQKYKCKSCKKHQQKTYQYRAYAPETHKLFIRFSTMGSGVRKTSSFLGVSVNTIQKWISKANCLQSTTQFPKHGEYDIDEIQTFVGKRKNKIWITYGWHVSLHKPVGLCVGSRRSEDLNVVVKAILVNEPRKINTDNYVAYPGLIDKKVHTKGKRKANHIERQHRNLRKDIAYLIRETMCFSKSKEMLEARIRWYFWGETDPYFFL